MKMLMLIAIMTTTAWGETFYARLHAYEQQYRMLRFDNGRVAWLKRHSSKLNKELNSFINHQVPLEISVSAEHDLLQIRRSATPASLEPITPTPNLEVAFEPSILKNAQEVQTMFERLNSNYKRLSECSDRAHIWAYEEYTQNHIKTVKAFIFFTASYINRHRFKWWFHVAPMTYVREGNSNVPRVLDYRFMQGPASIKQWTDLMVYSHRECKVTDRFSEYDVNPQTEDCYLIFESMYYRLPLDIQRRESHKRFLNEFQPAEIEFAMRASFKSARRNDND
jgi:hypothetical protein